MKPPRRKLDHIVRFALGVFITSFVLIFGGMFLTRPDRSIPPYSIGFQEGSLVAMHVPRWTSDTEIETLIRRFQKVAHESRNFGLMKIQPTTPSDPDGRYDRMMIYIFTQESWTQPDVVERYVAGTDLGLQREWREAVRGSYVLDGAREEGRIGPILDQPDSPATAAYSRLLFKGSVESLDSRSPRAVDQNGAPVPYSGVPVTTRFSPTPASADRAGRDL